MILQYKHWRDFPMDQWRWPSFSPAELSCRDYGGPDEGALKIDTDAMDKLQALRDLLGKPLILNSAFRPERYNRKIKGAKNSEHIKARAYDVSMSNHNPAVFEAAARQVGFTGFGFYKRNNFMHIDTGAPRSWGKRWFRKLESMPPKEAVAVASHVFSQETKLEPESILKDRELLAAGAGVVTAGGGVLSALSENAQMAAIIMLGAMALVGIVFFLRRDKHI